MMSKYKKCCAIAVGLVYVVSGLLKVMDPVGTGLIVEAYFRFMHLPESVLAAKILGGVLGDCSTLNVPPISLSNVPGISELNVPSVSL